MNVGRREGFKGTHAAHGARGEDVNVSWEDGVVCSLNDILRMQVYSILIMRQSKQGEIGITLQHWSL